LNTTITSSQLQTNEKALKKHFPLSLEKLNLFSLFHFVNNFAQIKARGPTLIGVLPSLAGEEVRQGTYLYYDEAVKGGPYQLLW
jgi:hypothetical protein